MAFLRIVSLCVAALVLMLVSGGSSARATSLEVVSLSADSIVSLATPSFVQAGKRYAFTWAGGGPAQTYTVKSLRSDGWILVEVADEITNQAYFVPGEFPMRWLNVASAISIQEMRPHQ